MTSSERALPHVDLLSKAEAGRLHDAALWILEEVGARVVSERAREILLAAGALPGDGDEILTIPRGLVEDAIAKAPSSFSLYGRDGEEAFPLGAGETHYGAGVTNLAYLDLDGNRRDFTLDDIGEVARLADGLPNIDFVATPGVVRQSADLPVELVNQNEFVRMVTNTTMPLVVLIAGVPELTDVFEMAALVAGSRGALAERPFVMPYLNPVSPLLMNPETTDKLLLAADWGMPAVVQAAPPIGGSTPVTVGSALAIAAAESLFNLALLQAHSPGAKFVTGVVPFIMDMSSGAVAATGPDMLLMMIAMGQLARFWELPSLGVGGGGDSKIPDEQAASDVLYYSQGVVLGGTDMSFDAGCLECGLLFSPQVLVYADDAIGMHRHFMQGIPLDDEALALDVIKTVGPGGFFLGEPHTLRHFREMWSPGLGSWEPRENWEAKGSTTMGQRANERARAILAEHGVEPLPDAVLAGFDEIIEARRATIPEEED